MRARLREIAEAAILDPKQALLDSLGDISGVEVLYNNVMVATYIAPPRIVQTAEGPKTIHLPDRSHEEDRFQGKAALVIKLGPTAFKYDGSYPYEGPKIEPGDWVFLRPSDGMEMFKASAEDRNTGTSCRIIEDRFVLGRVKDPAAIW